MAKSIFHQITALVLFGSTEKNTLKALFKKRRIESDKKLITSAFQKVLAKVSQKKQRLFNLTFALFIVLSPKGIDIVD